MVEKRILSAEAHDDDGAWLWAGFLARWARIKKVYSVDSVVFTNSNGQGIGQQRSYEQREMMDILGMKRLYAVGQEKNFFDGDLSLKYFKPMAQALQYILDQAIEEGHPYTDMITFDKSVTGHPDHFMVWSVIQDIFDKGQKYYSTLKRLWKVGMSPDERDLWLEDYKKDGGYFVPIPEHSISNYTPIDISSVFDLKIKAIQAHRSQLTNGGDLHIARLNRLPRKEYFNVVQRR